MLSSQIVWPCDPMTSILSMDTSCSLQNSFTADANVFPSKTFISDSSSGVVRLCRIMFMTRFLIFCSNGISPYLSSSKCIGASGLVCRNLHSAQSMPSILVPLFKPRTVRSNAVVLPLMCSLWPFMLMVCERNQWYEWVVEIKDQTDQQGPCDDKCIPS